MFLLDTNVLSEPLRPHPEARVLAWLDAQSASALWISSISLAEMAFGVACLPEGQRKSRLNAALVDLSDLFAGRILMFDDHAARAYGQIASQARAAGQGLPIPDGYIAAIAAARDLAVASRDVHPFRAAGLRVINPWEFGH